MQSTNSAAVQKTVIADGGFRIEISADTFIVVPDGRAHVARRRTVFATVAVVLVCVAGGLYLVTEALDDGFTFLLALGLLTIGFLWAYWRGEETLTCSRDSVVLKRTARGTVRATRVFPRDSLKRVRFDTVGISRFGSVNGILFDAGGKKIKTLPNLESPEAQTILREFDRFGYDVVHDVGMPMMVEMALERRRSGVL